MQLRRGRRHHEPAGQRCPAVSVGDHPAGRLDDRHQGHDVVGVQPGLDDQIHVAQGEQAVAVAVAPEALQLHFSRQLSIGRFVGTPGKHARMGGRQPGLTQAGGGPGLQPAPASGARVPSFSGHGRERFAEEGLAHPSRHRSAVDDQAQEHSPRRESHDVGLGAVDGVDDPPGPGAVGAGQAALLAFDLGLGKAALEAGAQHLLGCGPLR